MVSHDANSVDLQAEREAEAMLWLARELGVGVPECPLDARLRRACQKYRYSRAASCKAHRRIQQGIAGASYKPVTLEDRQRHARRRLERAKMLLELQYEPRKWVPVTVACTLVDAKARTVQEWVEKGYVARINGMVSVKDLRRRLQSRLAA